MSCTIILICPTTVPSASVVATFVPVVKNTIVGPFEENLVTTELIFDFYDSSTKTFQFLVLPPPLI